MQKNDPLSAPHIQAKRFNDEGGHSSPSPRKKHFRSIFISDLHLGTKDAKTCELAEFLKHHSCDSLYLVGDILDGWRMRSGVHWQKSANRVVRKILKISKSGIPVYYITGNHDEFLRKFANSSFDTLQLLNRATHTSASGKKYLVIHGDQFEGVTQCSAVLKYVGDVGYEFLMFANRVFNYWRQRAGWGFWSVSAFLRNNIQRAKKYVHDYECAVAYGAKKQGFDGVICGHIHHAASREIDGVEYLNTGDWVESCTAIAEDHKGNFHLIHWLNSPEHLHKVKKRKKAKVNIGKKALEETEHAKPLLGSLLKNSMTNRV